MNPNGRSSLVVGLVLLAIICAFAASVWNAVAVGAAFEYDEAVYANKARNWALNEPVAGFEPHRGVVLPALGVPVARATDDERWFRAVGLIGGVALLLGTFALGRTVAGPSAALIATAAVAAAPSVQQRSAQFLTDVPAAAALVWLSVVLWRALNGRRAPRLVLLWAAPLAALAFFLRYGSLVPIAAIVATAVILWRRALAGRVAAATLALFVALLIPHLKHSMDLFGTPWGIVTFTAGRAGRAYVGEGLWDYVRWVPRPLAGVLAGALVVLALLAVVARRGVRRDAIVFLAAPALAHVVIVGLGSHGEPRFVFFPLAILCVLGAIVAARAVTSAPRAVLAGVVVAGALVGAGGATGDAAKRAAVARQEVRDAGRALGALAGAGCRAWSTADAPIGWYSGCVTFAFPIPSELRPCGPARCVEFVALFDRGDVVPAGGEDPRARRQPPLDELAPYRPEPVAAVPDGGGRFGGARIYRITR